MQKITISHPSDAGQRIDRFCKKYLPNAALGGIYKMLRTGKIKVNGKKKDQTYKIEDGDEITLWMSDEEIGGLRDSIDSPSDKRELEGVTRKGIPNNVTHPNLPLSGKGSEHCQSPLTILYEDEYLMVLDKPAGLNVHSGDHKTTESNLIDQVQDYLKGKYDSLTFRPALVHRIDRDTSGCILVAKEKPTLEALLSDLQDHKIEKVYHALVSGIPAKPTDTIRARLLRVEDARDEAKVRVDEAGQSAVTHYTLIQNSKLNEVYPMGKIQEKQSGILNLASGISFSLLECRIETGRTHQIRVHLAYIGCPILGDKAYGDKKINSYMARHQGIARQMLHARVLSFVHPISKKRLRVEAPYPEDFQKMMNI